MNTSSPHSDEAQSILAGIVVVALALILGVTLIAGAALTRQLHNWAPHPRLLTGTLTSGQTMQGTALEATMGGKARGALPMGKAHLTAPWTPADETYQGTGEARLATSNSLPAPKSPIQHREVRQDSCA